MQQTNNHTIKKQNKTRTDNTSGGNVIRQKKKKKKKKKVLHDQSLYFAITSTYRPPFFLPRPPAGPFRAVGAPSRSSIELALLNDVDGRGGGGASPSPGPGAEPAILLGGVSLDTDRGRGGGPPRDDDNAGLPAIDEGAKPPGPAEDDGRLDAIGGVLPKLATLGALLGGPIRLGGGGGVADGVALPGSFLLTHFFSSVS